MVSLVTYWQKFNRKWSLPEAFFATFYRLFLKEMLEIFLVLVCETKDFWKNFDFALSLSVLLSPLKVRDLDFF